MAPKLFIKVCSLSFTYGSTLAVNHSTEELERVVWGRLAGILNGC